MTIMREVWDKDRFVVTPKIILDTDWTVRVMDASECRMCFVTDHDGHWYLIDAGMRQMFMDLLEGIKDEDSPKWYLWEQNFANKRCLPPTAYTFLDPKEMG